MINIERKLQRGWGLESFLKELSCSSEEELFELLKRDFSRKTAKSYIMRMKKNSLKNNNQIVVQTEKTEESFENVLPEIQPEAIIEEEIKGKLEQRVQKKRWLSKIIDFFKKC